MFFLTPDLENQEITALAMLKHLTVSTISCALQFVFFGTERFRVFGLKAAGLQRSQMSIISMHLTLSWCPTSSSWVVVTP